MTDRTCSHGVMPHRHCQRCEDFSNARQDGRIGLFMGLMKSAGDYAEVRTIRAFLRQEMKRSGVVLPPPERVISVARRRAVIQPNRAFDD